ncbi:hypothetical protein [Glacieibacterium sp.]|uniref:hypothetical protein n=1 Tax=Glacieibacterium sp. TaxID=2860237 RepID=UPI003AFF96A5
MKFRICTSTLVRSSSTIALAACFAFPAPLLAQVPSAGAEATNAQPGAAPSVAQAETQAAAPGDEIVVTGIPRLARTIDRHQA